MDTLRSLSAVLPRMCTNDRCPVRESQDKLLSFLRLLTQTVEAPKKRNRTVGVTVKKNIFLHVWSKNNYKYGTFSDQISVHYG